MITGCEALNSVWGGDALVLWRPPPLDQYPINEQSSAGDVKWLRRAINLESINYGGDVLGNLDLPEFDTPLIEQLNRFQSRVGLPHSEEAGIEELINLNSRLGFSRFPVILR